MSCSACCRWRWFRQAAGSVDAFAALLLFGFRSFSNVAFAVAARNFVANRLQDLVRIASHAPNFGIKGMQGRLRVIVCRLFQSVVLQLLACAAVVAVVEVVHFPLHSDTAAFREIVHKVLHCYCCAVLCFRLWIRQVFCAVNERELLEVGSGSLPQSTLHTQKRLPKTRRMGQADLHE